MTFKMPAQLKADWLTALRSGAYTQAKYKLEKGTITGGRGFCCLGVLQQVADGQCEMSNDGFADYPTVGWWQDHGCQFPELSEHLDSPDVYLGAPIAPQLLDHTDHPVSVGVLNDVVGLNFNQLADLIEAQVETV